MNLLEADNIVKEYTGHKALDDVSMHVAQGEVHGLLGPNGAGKTTLIRIINHITAPDKGSVVFDGHPLTADDVAMIGYLPEERGLYKKMRVGEQALFFARLKGLNGREAEKNLKEWFDRLEMGGWWNKKIEELSKGMAQKVQFVITVLHRPKLLIFDEPFSGFDPINANLLKREILRLRDEGSTVIFSTHNMSSVEELCDSITLINKSRVILSGNVDELRRNYGENCYELEYAGDGIALLPAIGNMAEIHASEPGKLRLRLRPGVSRHDLIETANGATDLMSFAPFMPSMDNIFINAVKAAGMNTTEN